jgi:hypothetical protein
MTLRQFIKTVKENQGNPIQIPPWDKILPEQGYIGVDLTTDAVSKWQELHKWCQEHIGEEHYSWTGYKFWFEKEKDAIMFVLRWQ